MQPTSLINIGFGNFIARNRITGITKRHHGKGLKKRLGEIEKVGLLINLTSGRRALSIIQLDSGHLILSYLTPEELQERLERNDTTTSDTKTN